MDASYLPSRRVAIFGVVVLIILATIAGVKYMPTSANSQNQPVTATDADEIETGQAANFSRRAPDQRTGNIDEAQTAAATRSPATGTEAASKLPDGRTNKTKSRLADLAPRIAKLADSGNYTQGQLNTVLEDLLTAQADKPAPLTRADITIQADTEENYTQPQKAEQYGTAVAEIIQSEKGSGIGNELKIVARAMQNNSQAELENIDPIIRAYSNIIQKLKSLPVPAEFAPAHLKLVDGLNAKRHALENMRFYIEDPLRGQTAINVYKQADRKTTLARETIAKLVSLRAQ